MSDEKKSGPASSGPVLFALLAAGALWMFRPPPLDLTRPPPVETRLSAPHEAQNVDARIWQDPLDAITKHLQKPAPSVKDDCAKPRSGGRNGAKAGQQTLSPYCRSPLMSAAGEPQTFVKRVLAVTVPSKSYFEDVEVRRRVRYAVLASLHVQGFEPADPDHIGYFKLPKGDKELPEFLAFERFDKRESGESLLVVWLEEEKMAVDARQKAVQLKRALCQEQGDDCVQFDVIGPLSSDMALRLCADSDRRPKDITFYIYGATQNVCDSRDIRAIGTDDALARALRSELIARLQAQLQTHGKMSIALISDRDSAYGREIVKTFASELKALGPTEQPTFIRLSFLRGMDGMLPNAEQNQKKAEKKDKDAKDAILTELPYGVSQFDYLRRLANELKDIAAGGAYGPIVAVGVLGTDVFDKLLVLRALKPILPEALFFTTDYDAALAAPDELNWSRNLLVASSYGPSLENSYQRDIPPFRSVYQTAAFVAVRMALEREGDFSGRVQNSLERPRLFEIDRNGAFAPLIEPKGRGEERAFGAGPVKQTLHPEIAAYPKISCEVRLSIAALCVLFAVLLSLLNRGCLLTKSLICFWYGVSLILLVAAIILGFWDNLAPMATQNGEGEQIAFLSGASMWPTIALRAAGVILAAALLSDACRNLETNMRAVEGLVGRKEVTERRPQPIRDWASFVSRVKEIFSYRLTPSSTAIDIESVWENYKLRCRKHERVIRSAVSVFALFVVYICLTYALGEPNNPWRGQYFIIYRYVTIILVFFLLLLVFSVVDSTAWCLIMVRILRHPTSWPKEIHEQFLKKTQIDSPLLDEIIDLRFIAKRTKCISGLIYYPFAIFAILLVARSAAFAAFTPSMAIVAAASICFVILFGCAIALCFYADRARRRAIQRIVEGLGRARAKGQPEGLAEQLEILLRMVEQIDEGAFVPLSRQPPIRALLLPIGGLSWTALIEYRLLPGM